MSRQVRRSQAAAAEAAQAACHAGQQAVLACRQLYFDVPDRGTGSLYGGPCACGPSNEAIEPTPTPHPTPACPRTPRLGAKPAIRVPAAGERIVLPAWLQEASLLRQLRHRNIVGFAGVCVTESTGIILMVGWQGPGRGAARGWQGSLGSFVLPRARNSACK